MHEVKANLVDAEKMFEAMGYTLLPNHAMILDGPICPDQVTNVSRDAMTAYAECQVLIYSNVCIKYEVRVVFVLPFR